MAIGPVCTLLALLGMLHPSWRRHVRADVENNLVSWRPAVRVQPAAYSQPPHQRLAHHAILSLRAKSGSYRTHPRVLWRFLYTSIHENVVVHCSSPSKEELCCGQANDEQAYPGILSSPEQTQDVEISCNTC